MEEDRKILELALLSISVYAAPECRRTAGKKLLAKRLDEIHGLAVKVLNEIDRETVHRAVLADDRRF